MSIYIHLGKYKLIVQNNEDHVLGDLKYNRNEIYNGINTKVKRELNGVKMFWGPRVLWEVAKLVIYSGMQ